MLLVDQCQVMTIKPGLRKTLIYFSKPQSKDKSVIVATVILSMCQLCHCNLLECSELLRKSKKFPKLFGMRSNFLKLPRKFEKFKDSGTLLNFQKCSVSFLNFLEYLNSFWNEQSRKFDLADILLFINFNVPRGIISITDW